jgi:AcrR family transcriptional regulator
VPKRDPAYMQGQRDLIIDAALECMIEKGVPETTLRDVCQRAGISMGALYVHFTAREELILAACAVDADVYGFDPLPDTWADFETAIVQMFRHMRTPREMRRLRLALQFVAELAVAETHPIGLEDHYRRRIEPYRELLAHLKARGEISLPLGLEVTTRALCSFLIGANYVMVSTFGSKSTEGLDEMLAATALLAGRKSPA